MSLQLDISARSGRKHAEALRDPLMAAHQLLRPRLKELSVALVGDQAMSLLHERFLGVPGPTDVLTFALDSDSRGRAASGEVVVCVPEARRQARRRGGSIDRELLLYALHGMLHLVGFDDKTESGYRQMHRKEDEILTALGIGPVFASPEPPANRSLGIKNRPHRRAR